MVDEEARDTDVVDPLAAYSGIALFPTTFGILPDPSKPRDPGTDLDDIHQHLKSMVLRSPRKLLEQAKTILDGNSNFMHSEIAKFLVTNEKKEEITAKAEENPQERRPALNRKRARFSLKPEAGQPAVNLEPTLDIKQLKDPEEFFLAYEKLENAKREIQKQTGGILKDFNQQNPSMNTRQRRPGILGYKHQRSVRYKHQYSSITSETDENEMPSQVTFESGNMSPSIIGSGEDISPTVVGSEKETYEDVPFVDELVASITKSENKVNKILDELLSANCEDLEGDRAINVLQECLKIKPVHVEKLCLPDLQGIQTINLKSSRRNFPKHKSTSVENLLQRIEGVKVKQDAETSIHPQSALTPLKSPLASLSSLKRQILLSNSSNDPFSAQLIDQSPIRQSSHFEHTNDLSDVVDVVKQSSESKSKSLLTKDGRTASNRASSPKVPVADANLPSVISLSNVLNVPQVGTGTAAIGTHIVEDNDIGGHNTEVEMNEKLSCHETQADALTNVTNALDEQMEERVELHSEEPDLSVVDKIEKHLIPTPSPLDPSTATFSENIVHGLSKTGGTNPDDKVKPKSRANKQQKDKKNSRRQSLAAAGTKWECGVRRSTRIRIRPLEYWKGERMLYGRVHESLATVIGLKYASPAKGNGQPTLKVKSYVSDEYKELVELAALH